MKKLSIILTLAAVGLTFTSCKQEDEPKYIAPGEATAAAFKINQSALENTEFRTAPEMTDNETFTLFCSQPDYGYSAVCNYSALVSLNPDAPLDEWIALENTNPTSAAMAIKTFELGAAVNKLLGVKSQEQFDNEGIYNNSYIAYFKAVCEIPGIEDSRVVSSNYCSLNRIFLTYSEKKPAWIYICGDVQNEDGSLKNGFLSPGPANLDAYMANWSLFEPENMIGEKLFVGVFWLTPKDPAEVSDYNAENPDACAGFRFFTQLVGWSTDYSLGSHSDDFYVLNISDKWAAGYSGDIVDHGLGNWGIFVTDPTPVTLVVDTKDLKVYIKEGKHDVTFVGRNPEFN